MAGRRLGLAAPTGDSVATDDLSVPGDAPTGGLAITCACDFGGSPVRASTFFDVVEDTLHRTAMFTSMPHPGTISLDGARLALSAAIAVIIFLFLVFPFQLFNSTLTENYDEVRSWFGLKPRPSGYQPARQSLLALVPLLAAIGLLYTLVSPDFGFDRGTLMAGVGLSLAVAGLGVAFLLPTMVYARRAFGEWGRVRFLPGSILVAVATVALSRLVGLLPGYIYGLLFVLSGRRVSDPKAQGRVGAVTAALLLTVTLAAWIALVARRPRRGGARRRCALAGAGSRARGASSCSASRASSSTYSRGAF